jgi:hypothetical protein
MTDLPPSPNQSMGLWQEVPMPAFRHDYPEPSPEEKVAAAQRYIESRYGMNDEHDNAATDREMLIRVQTDHAIDAFRDMMIVGLLLARKDATLNSLLTNEVDRERYAEETEVIRADFEARAEAIRKLPAPNPFR